MNLLQTSPLKTKLRKEVKAEISADPPSPDGGPIMPFKCCGLRPVGPAADPHHGIERISYIYRIDGARIVSIKECVIHLVLACINAQSDCVNLRLPTGQN